MTKAAIDQDEPRRSRRFQNRRAEILDAAEVVFGSRGFSGARLEEVAERVQMQRASLVYYFKDKNALYDQVITRIAAEIAERIDATRDEAGPMERMDAIASTWIDFLVERPRTAQILLRHMIDDTPPASPSVRPPIAVMLESIRSAIEEGRQSGQFKEVSAAEYAVIVAGASMLWVATQRAVKHTLSFDPLGPENLESHRAMLVQLTRQLLEVSREA